MPEVVLLGAAGHAKVVIEIFRESNEWEVVGCLSPGASGGSVRGVPILGGDGELERIFQRGIVHAFAAIGDNHRRLVVSARLREIGFRLVNAISGRAIVSPSVRLDTGIAVMPGAIINAESVVGAGAIINTGSTVDHDCRLGAYSHIGPGSNLAGGVHVGEGAFLGIGSRVIPNIVIGEWSIVGAGGVVIANLSAHATAVGIPARVVRIAAGK